MSRLRSIGLSIIRRRRRNALTLAAIGFGAASVVTVLGINDASAQQLSATIATYDATAITVSLPASAWHSSERDLAAFVPHTAGVVEAGTLTLPVAGTSPSRVTHPTTGDSVEANTVIATPAGVDARGAALVEGALPDDSVTSGSRLIALGRTLASDLRVNCDKGANQLLLDGQPATVVGIVKDGPDNATLNTSVLLTPSVARAAGSLPDIRGFLIRVEVGAAEALAGEMATRIFPRDTDQVSVGVSPSPQQLKKKLLDEKSWLVAAVGIVMFVSSAVSIATTTQIGVRERRREIGLSRALGMRRIAVAATFVAESTLLGLLGSIAGCLLGTLTAAGIAAANGWTFTLPLVVVAIPLVGSLTGAVASLLPAYAASKVDPASLLRT